MIDEFDLPKMMMVHGN